MKKRQKLSQWVVLFFLFSMLTLWALSVGWAQQYPSKPVTFQVHNAAGGSTDVGMRILCSFAEKILGQPMPVVNRVGGGGVVSYTQIARSTPDGYLIGSWASPVTAGIMLDPKRKVSFGPSDYTYIINHVYDPNVICVRNDSPFKALPDLIKAAKEQPGKISMAVCGKLGDDHLVAIDLQRRAGVKFNIVHFDSSAPGKSAVLGGHVQVYLGNQGDVPTHMKDGSFRMLAIADKAKSVKYPNIPLLMDFGYPVVGASARGIAGPKGLSKDILYTLEAAFKKATEDPAHIERMEKMGLPIRFMGSNEYTEFLAQDFKRVAELIPEAMKAP